MSASRHTAGTVNGGVSAAASRFTVTFFRNHGASTKAEALKSLDELARQIAATTAREKKTLPWLKLAVFGNQKSDKNSLRHDGNVLAITGVEGDYDAERIDFDTAVETITKAGILALVYTSPSHTEDRQRWRVLCPVSGPMPPDQREKYFGRLNGLYRGIFSGESWALSQSYYFGSVNSNPSHRVEVIDGTPIDMHDELDEIWLGKPNTAQRAGAAAGNFKSGPVDEAALLQQIVGGQSYHLAHVRLLGRWARDGVAYMDARSRLVEAMEAVPAADRDARWQVRFADIDRCLEDIYGKEARVRDAGARTKGETKPAARADEPPPHTGDDPGDAGDWTTEIEPPTAVPEHPALANPSSAIEEARAATVRRFNLKYMLVNENGRATIYQPGFDPALKRRHYTRLSPRDLDVLYINDPVPYALDEHGKTIFKPSSFVWMRNKNRRQFIDGVVFDPSTTEPQPGVLNLWEGFAVKPKPGDWSLLRGHVRDVICGGNEECFAYLMGWMARMVQHPAKQGEVAVVLKGGEGVGKGTLARALLRILGQHGMAISNAKHLVGNFNGHLRDAVFLFADEAFFAGDRAHVGVLKSIITEPYLTIEAKFQNADQMANYLHVMMASNEEWVVPAALDARRFLVLLVDEANRGNHPYFDAIWGQMEAGGYEAMLADLLALDLTHFNVRAVPQTEGLREQRTLSLPIPEAWWKDCLERGYVFRSRLGLEATFAEWADKVSTELLFASYCEFAEARRERHLMSRETLGRFMHRMGAQSRRLQNAPVGEHMADEPTMFGGSHRVAKAVIHPRPMGYSVGNLAVARAGFDEATGLAPSWDADDEA